jgi:hypothetical protein
MSLAVSDISSSWDLDLNLFAVLRQHLDVELERLELLDQDLKRFEHARLKHVLALDGRFVRFHATHEVVGLDRSNSCRV